MLKRIFDILLAIILLPAFLILTILISIWIKSSSKGNIFFLHERVGLRGKLFKVYKFRTMTQVQNKNALQITAANDARITSAGRFLRKSKLDELPQLINIIKGEMSFVGPRPEVASYMQMYEKEVRDKILSVRPGLTDYAAINFRDEEKILAKSENPNKTYIEEIMPIKQKYYLDYVSNNSITGDIIILYKTFLAILK